MLGKIVLIGGVGLVALAAIGDVAARSLAEDRIAARAESAAGGQASASADIESFPFVLRLLLGGKAGDISVHVEDVVAPGLNLARVDLDLEGVELDRDILLSKRKARITDVALARVTAHIDAATVSKAFGGLQVSFRDGAVHASIGGRDVAAAVSVQKGRLAVRFPGGPSATIPIPHTDLLACDADAFELEDDELVVSCSTTEVPPALLRAAQAG